MNVVVIKGPMFEQAKEQAQKLLYEVLVENVKKKEQEEQKVS